MATEPSNPGVIILAVLAGLMLVPAILTGVSDAVFGRNSGFLVGVVGGLVAVGIAFAAIRSPAESKAMLWVAFFVSIPGLGLLVLNGTGNDDGIGGMALGIIAGFFLLPLAIALATQSDLRAAE